MQIYHALPHPPLGGTSALTIGNFDGIHLGHQALVRRMLADAHEKGWQGGLLTFSPHPTDLLRPQASTQLLTELPERLAVLEGLGLDFAVVYPFTLETARTPARVFVGEVQRALNMASLWVGPDFALGRNREGDVRSLRLMGEEMAFTVQVIESQFQGTDEVRSGLIRQLLWKGEVDLAARKLGRLYQVPGVVVQGAQRGRSIGFPTANLAVSSRRLLPADGVYATWAVLGEGNTTTVPGRLPSVTNIGVRPSFDNGERTVEAHLLDFQGDLYGQALTLAFVRRIRPEMHFSGIDSLRQQIARDVAVARHILASDG